MPCAAAGTARRIWPALTLGAALLAACQAELEPAAPEPLAPKPAAETAAPADGPEAGAVADEAAPPPPEVAELPPAAPPEPVVDDDPQRLMGLGRDQVDALLGAPDLVRREPPAEIRQYSAERCVFDVFLYDDGGGGYRVTYLEARDLDAQRVAARPCLNRLLRAQLVGQSG